MEKAQISVVSESLSLRYRPILARNPALDHGIKNIRQLIPDLPARTQVSRDHLLLAPMAKSQVHRPLAAITRRTSFARGRAAREDLRDDGDRAVCELSPALDEPLEVAPAQAFDRLVLAPEAVHDVAAEQGAPVEGGREEEGPVDEFGEADDADGVVGAEVDYAFGLARLVVEVAGEVPLEGLDCLVEDVLNVVFVREANNGGDLVEREGSFART